MTDSSDTLFVLARTRARVTLITGTSVGSVSSGSLVSDWKLNSQ